MCSSSNPKQMHNHSKRQAITIFSDLKWLSIKIDIKNHSEQNHNPFGTGPGTRDALILIRGGMGQKEEKKGGLSLERCLKEVEAMRVDQRTKIRGLG